MTINEIHPFRARILPVPEETFRPLWSVMIPTYNCADYLRETLNSVLAQDLGADVMQIEVVDDCSTLDDPAAVVREIAGDRVKFYQQSENVGYIKNFEICLQRSCGQWVHLLHGDDCIRPGFYQKLQQGFEKNPEIGAAFCRHIFMDEQSHWMGISSLEQPDSGILEGWLEEIATNQRIQAPSIVVRREVYEQLGGFDSRMRCWGEDWEMWVRIAACYPVWYEVEPLALYRNRSLSLSGRSIKTGENLQDFRRAISIVKNYLPDDRSNRILKKTLEIYALYGIRCATEFAIKGDISSAFNQIKEAIRCSRSLRVMYHLVKFMGRVSYSNLKSSIPQET
jgi:glycosyltransferase involved in cell wall biosynthesis